MFFQSWENTSKENYNSTWKPEKDDRQKVKVNVSHTAYLSFKSFLKTGSGAGGSLKKQYLRMDVDHSYNKMFKNNLLKQGR